MDVTVLTDGVSESAREKVVTSLPAGSVRVRWLRVDLAAFTRVGRLDHVSRMTFARFQIPDAFGPETARVLYLDADLLVLGDLTALMQIDLRGAPVAAVLDHHIDADIRAARVDRIVDVPRVRRYFNAGVLLIDLPEWRRRQVSQRALEFLRAHPNTPYADQDALNVACDDTWMELDRTWNFQNHHATRIDRRPSAERPAIVHFITSTKPWKPSSSSVNAALYDGFRSRTCFRRSPTEKAVAAVRTLGYRIKYRLARMTTMSPAPGRR
jgi:lipopolysaccharide biosynthesis glycosyltransferase